ncbi:hypothetical protein ACIPYS_27085 [Kitasatospora sp. NPDC089913]|uniref:hypothetical protein n=1 Tax=Kitasatospora sp. NPDC089913 TaxID=3364080 RepID=UPI00382C3468
MSAPAARPGAPVEGFRTAPEHRHPRGRERRVRGRERRVRVWERRVCSAGLPPLWAGRCTVLSEPARRAAAVRHTAATLAALPGPYRLVFALLMRVFPAAVVLADPTGPFRGAADRTRPRRVADRLSAVPGCAELLRVSLALALHGALDGAPDGAVYGQLPGAPPGPPPGAAEDRAPLDLPRGSAAAPRRGPR